MLHDGAMDGVDAIFGLHVWFDVPAGQVALSPGPQMASAGIFRARIHGQGGHGALPQHTVDPIVLSAQAILALQTVVSRRLSPTDAGVVTVGTVHGGTQDNIIPPYVDLTGTVRSLNNEVYRQIEREIERALGVVRALGGEYEVEFARSVNVVDNDADLTAFVARTAVDLLGAEAVLPAEPAMTGEDFSVLAENVPGCFMRLGGRFPGQPLRNHHDPHFDVDERALPIGAAMMAEVALRYLALRAQRGAPTPERRSRCQTQKRIACLTRPRSSCLLAEGLDCMDAGERQMLLVMAETKIAEGYRLTSKEKQVVDRLRALAGEDYDAKDIRRKVRKMVKSPTRQDTSRLSLPPAFDHLLKRLRTSKPGDES